MKEILDLGSLILTEGKPQTKERYMWDSTVPYGLRA
jgi:hypothetical protein